MTALWWEFRYQTKVFWRVPLAAFFTVVFPLMFLLLFGLLNGDATIDVLGGISFAQFFTPAIAVFSVVTATYTNLVITTAMQRDNGILKRVLATPLPRWAAVGGRVLAAVGTGFLSVVVMTVVGVALFDVRILWERLPLAIAILVVGAAAWSALGLAVAGLVSNGRAAPAVANATILPLAFISGVFFPVEAGPEWLATVAALFPLRPFVAASSAQWNPTIDATVPWADLAVLLIWGVLGGIVAVRRFRWEPARLRS